MEDAWRWRFMRHILGMREGFPQDTYDRVMRFSNFLLHVGRPLSGASMRDGRVELATPAGPFLADFVIAGTGMENEFALRPELAGCAGNIATWGDRYDPPAEERDERLGRFPYLSGAYAFVEKVAGRTPWISDIHLFGIATTMSFGPSGSSINAMTIAVPRLVAGVTLGLFRQDVGEHWAALREYAVPQVVLDRARIVGPG